MEGGHGSHHRLAMPLLRTLPKLVIVTEIVTSPESQMSVGEEDHCQGLLLRSHVLMIRSSIVIVAA